LIRNALRPVARRDAGAVAKEFKKIYTAPTEQAAFDALAEFAASPWGKKYPQAVKVWEDAWEAFTPYLAFTGPVRKLLYTTNGIESLNYQLRKVTKPRGHFPGDDAVVKLLWLAIINIEDKRARERAAKREKKDKHAFTPARLVEGQRFPDDAKHSTNSASPTQDESGKQGSPSTLKSIYTPQVTSSSHLHG
jgi:transposase-like protein